MWMRLHSHYIISDKWYWKKTQAFNSYALKHSADPMKSWELSQQEPCFSEIARYFIYCEIFFFVHMCVWISFFAGLGWVFPLSACVFLLQVVQDSSYYLQSGWLLLM